MKNKLSAIVLIILSAVLTSVAQTKDVRSVVEAGEVKFSALFAKGDSQSISELYGEDAKVLPPNGIIVEGRMEIREFWHKAWDAGVKKVETKTKEVEDRGDLAYEVGTYVLYGSDEVLDEGKYLVVWKKDGGDWRMFRDIWNSSRK